MSRADAIICDVCGRQKLEANHWLIAFANETRIVFKPSDAFEREGLRDGQYEDICGADCAHKRLSQWLTQQGI